MLDDVVEIVSRILFSIFKKRPYIAFFVLIGLFIIGLGIWILAAKSQEERLFPIIALAFVLIVLAWYTRLVVKRWDLINKPSSVQTEKPAVQEPELVSVDPAAAAAPLIQPTVAAVAPIAAAAGVKPSVQALHVILGAVAAVVISAPLVLIASLAMSVSPIVAEEEVEGFAIVVGVLLCLLIPIAAGLGALFGATFTRAAKVRTKSRLTWRALLVGGVTGFVLGLLAMIVFYLLASAPV